MKPQPLHFACLALALCLAAPPAGSAAAREGAPTGASGIVVTTFSDSTASDGLCSLREALTNANDNAASFADCPAGSGADSITFALGGTILLTAPLPPVTDPAGLTVDAANHLVVVSGSSMARPFTISAGAQATLRSLTLQQGMADLGGAILNHGTLQTTGVTLRNNTATLAGGAIYNTGVLTLTGMVVADNAAGTGGGIHNTGTATVATSTVRSNAGATGGGFYNETAASLTLESSTIHHNTFSVNGGGVYNAGTLVLANSTVHANTAAFLGAGVYSSGTLHVRSSTLSSNGAGFHGGGIYVASGVATMINNILANNIGGPGPDCGGPMSALGMNLIEQPAGCLLSGQAPISGDPLLGPLGDFGGPTKTQVPGAGSPAKDAGDDAACAAAPASGRDQRGVTRPVGAHCDLGAVEGETLPGIGGRNLVLRAASATTDLSWDPGSAQDAYALLTHDFATAPTITTLPGSATTYQDVGGPAGGARCYVTVPTNLAGTLGLSDLLCAVRGLQSGGAPALDFALTLQQTATTTLTWLAPLTAADSYLLQTIPLDGAPATATPLAGSALSASAALNASGACYQLIAFQGSSFSTTEALCGVPGFATLAPGASLHLPTGLHGAIQTLPARLVSQPSR